MEESYLIYNFIKKNLDLNKLFLLDEGYTTDDA